MQSLATHYLKTITITKRIPDKMQQDKMSQDVMSNKTYKIMRHRKKCLAII